MRKFFLSHRTVFYFLMLFGAIIFSIQTTNAQTAYNPGKLAVLVVGDGSAALSAVATPVFVKEFNISGGSQAGVLRTSLPTVATSGTGSVNRALTQSGSSTAEGYIGLSDDRQLLVTAGYNSSVGTAGVSASVITLFPTNARVVGKINAAGVADTKTTLNNASSASAIRSATTVDGSAFWTAGQALICYVPEGNISAPTTLSSTNTRVISIFNSQLYTTTQSGATLRLAKVGTGLPTSGSPTLTNLNGFLTSTGDPYSFSFIDINGGGPDIVYVASQNAAPAGLLKYTSSDNGATWVSRGSITGNVFGLTAVYRSCGSTGNVDLYITSNTSNAKPNSLYQFTDLAVSVGSPSNITSNGLALNTVGTLLATAATNTAFGGVAFTPGTTLTNPAIYNLTGGSGCIDPGAVLGLSNSEKGVSYQVFRDGTPVGSALAGTGAGISFGVQFISGAYSVVATNLLTGCTATMSGSFKIKPLVSFGGLSTQYCASSSAVTLTGTPFGGAFTGPGMSGNVFNPATAGVGGPYTITYSYTNTETGCSNSISQTVSVKAVPAVNMTVSANTICAGASTNLVLDFTGTAPWHYSINGGSTVITSNDPEIIPINPSATTTYDLALIKDANCMLNEWVSISAGNHYSHGIKSDGTLWTWGLNTNGQLGDGTIIDRNKPVKIGSLSNWAKVATGNTHSLAIKNDGSLWAWGFNNYGALGDGTTSAQSNPVQIGTSTDWADVFCTPAHTLALKTNGTLWAWGLNVNGELGDGSFTDRHSPVQIGTATDWATISGGQYSSMGIKSGGTLWGWGANLFGELGMVGSPIVPIQNGVLTSWYRIYSGLYHNLAIQTNGTLWAWGRNAEGQLGDGTNIQRNSPVQIGSATNWVAVCTESHHSMAIKSDGTLWGWGQNINGQVGDGTNIDKNSPVQIGNPGVWTKMAAGPTHSLGIKSGGELWAWGSNIHDELGDGTSIDKNTPIQVNMVTSSVTVTVNPLPTVSFSGLAASYCMNAGAVILTGSPAGGVFSGPGVTGNIFTPSSAGVALAHTITYTYSNGTCSNIATQNVAVNALPVISFSGLAANYCITASPVTITSSHIGVISGPGITNHLNGTATFDPAAAGVGGPYTISFSYTDVVTGCSNTYTEQVSVNAMPAVGMTASSSSICIGASTNLVLNFTGTGPWTYSINGGAEVSTTNNPQIIPVNPDTTTVYDVTSLSNDYCISNEWVSVAAGSYHSLGIKADGTLWTWGSNNSGQLGIGNNDNKNKAVKVGTSSNWAKVSAGAVHSLAIKKDGTLWAWGSNFYGQIGTGSSTNSYNVPKQIGTGTNWWKIDAGGTFCLAIKTDGTLWGWGNNGYGNLGDGTTLSRNAPVQIGVETDWADVSAGENHVLGLKTNGTLWSWGLGVFGQLGGAPPINAPNQVGAESNWATVYAGQSNSFAIKTNGSIWSWGRNSLGELGKGFYSQFNTPGQVGVLTNWASVSSYSGHTIALKQDGTIWACGLNNDGEQGNGTSGNGSTSLLAQSGAQTNWSKISTGLHFSLGIKTDRSLWSWGDNISPFGQLGDGTFTDRSNPVQVKSLLSSVSITVNPLPVVSFSGLATRYCSNSVPVTLTGSPAGGVFSGPGISGNTFNPANAGLGGPYTITYTYNDVSTGCSNSSSKLVWVAAPISFTGLAAQYCVNASPVTLTGSQPGISEFSGPGISGNVFNPAAAGVGGPYTITYSHIEFDPDESADCSNTFTQTVTVLAQPTVSFTGLSSQYCVNANPVTLTGSPAGGIFSGPGISGNSFDPAAAGSGGPYTITYTYTNANGCTNFSVQTVTVNALPIINFTGLPAGICLNANPVALSGSPSGGTFSGTAISGNIFNPAIAGIGGPYTITYSYTNTITGCSNSVSQQVTVNALPTVSISGNDYICFGGNTLLTANANPGSGTISSYQWIRTTLAGSQNAGTGPTLLTSQGGTYTVTVTNTNGCTAVSPGLNVTAFGIPSVSFTGLSAQYCLNSPSVILIGSQAGNGSFGGTFSGPGITDNLDGTASFSPAAAGAGGPYTITYTYTIDFTSCTYSSSQMVTVNALPVVSFAGLSSAYCSADVTVTLTGSPAGGLFSGPGIVGNTFDPAIAGEGGSYTIVYSYTNENGCTNTASQQVTVTNCTSFATLNLKMFIQGYYQNIGTATAMDNFGMGGCLYVNGLSENANDADHVEVSLMSTVDGTLVETQTGVLHTDGTLSVDFAASRNGGSYWLRVRHRNSIETWSAAPVEMSTTTPYDFTTAANKAYGDNQVEVEPGIWAIYSGDIIDADTQTPGMQDAVIESSDYSLMENDVYNVTGGYVPADITGDGVVESADYSIMENNVYLVVSALKPFF